MRKIDVPGIFVGITGGMVAILPLLAPELEYGSDSFLRIVAFFFISVFVFAGIQTKLEGSYLQER